jgi:DNA-binding transcriptional ArsR family regulator
MREPVDGGTEVRVSDSSALHARVVVSPLLTLAVALIDTYGDHPATVWRTLLRERARGLDAEPVAMFGLPAGMVPDSLLSLPSASFATFERELAAVRAQPLQPILDNLELGWSGRELPAALEPFRRDPAAALQRYCDAMEAHWQRLLAPSWPRIRRLLDREVLLVGHTLATDGLAGALGSLHPRVSYADGRLRYRTGHVMESTYVAEQALILMPLACEPEQILANEDHPDGTVIAYAARGAAELWEPPPAANAELARLLGDTRAALALALATPSTTTDLALRLRLAPSTVSRHLSGLAETGLVDRTRCGPLVYYRLTARGEALLDLF